MLQECLLKLYKSSLKCKAKGAAKIEQESKYIFSNYKTGFFSFFFTLTPPTSSVHNFLIFLVQIEWFKLLWNCHLKLYKSSSNTEGNKLIFKNFLRGSKVGYELFSWIFLVKTNPPTLGDCNFLAYSPFLPIFSARDLPRGGLHLVLGHHKQWGPPAKWQANPTSSDCSWAVLP
jgi:hypothetical protein